MFNLIANSIEILGIAYLIFLGHGIPTAILTDLTAAVSTAKKDVGVVVTTVEQTVDPATKVTTTTTAPAAAVDPVAAVTNNPA
jgi:hypothetical protein